MSNVLNRIVRNASIQLKSAPMERFRLGMSLKWFYKTVTQHLEL